MYVHIYIQQAICNIYRFTYIYSESQLTNFKFVLSKLYLCSKCVCVLLWIDNKKHFELRYKSICIFILVFILYIIYMYLYSICMILYGCKFNEQFHNLIKATQKQKKMLQIQTATF